MKIIILAGGIGARLWPISKKDFPKQFMHFGDGETLLQKTVKRFLAAEFTEEILISTNSIYAPLVEEQISKIDFKNKCEIFIEPSSKNTCPAISLAVKYLCEKNGPSEILVVPSDHYITPEAKLHEAIQRSSQWIKKQKIVAFGVRPQKPETGYGYLQLGKSLNDQAYQVEKFCEKPDFEIAQKFFLSGEYFWNSGMIAFNSDTFWSELKVHCSSIYQNFSENYLDSFQRYATLPEISIDYALLEKTKNMVVISLDATWSDVGSWDRVYDVLEKDQNRNVKRGNIVDIETKNSLILGDKKLISTIGLEDMLIVETDEAIFIAKKGESEKVRLLLEKMKKNVK